MYIKFIIYIYKIILVPPPSSLNAGCVSSRRFHHDFYSSMRESISSLSRGIYRDALVAIYRPPLGVPTASSLRRRCRSFILIQENIFKWVILVYNPSVVRRSVPSLRHPSPVLLLPCHTFPLCRYVAERTNLPPYQAPN